MPVFFGIGLGLVGGWTRDVDNHHVGELNALVMDFAVPASIFAAVVTTSRGTLIDQLGLALVLTVTMLLVYALVSVMTWKGIVTVTKYGRILGGRRDWRHEAAT